MKSVLITGANKGIGFETTRQLIKKGYYVYLGARDLKKGEKALSKLNAQNLMNVEVIQIDVNNTKSIETATKIISGKTEKLDILINNAAINGGHPQTATGTEVNRFQEVFETNFFGVVRVTQSFMELLKKAEEPRIVNVSTSLASLTLHNDTSWDFYDVKIPAYECSKAALNMYTINLAYEMRDTSLKVNSVDPGWTDTEFTNNQGTGSVELAASRIIEYAIMKNCPSGKFISEEYNQKTKNIPW